MFERNFDKVLRESDRVWLMHKRNKGNSWKTLSSDVIANLVKEEYHEWRNAYRNTLKAIADNNPQEEVNFEQLQFEELLDLINVCLILAEKLRQKLEGKE